jgi:DNA modification methylase
MIRLLHGDCRTILPTLADASVHACITSPPYWNLRDYQTGTWEGGLPDCDHVKTRYEPQSFVDGHGPDPNRSCQSWKGGERNQTVAFTDICGKCGARRVDRQIGLEKSPDEYLATMVGVFREIKRILRDDGCVFCNLGDSYSNKQLQMMPARLALALQNDGWILRSQMPWLKRSSMPESTRDRPSSAVEYVYLFVKQSRYFWDAEAVKRGAEYGRRDGTNWKRPRESDPNDKRRDIAQTVSGANPETGRNMRNSDLFYDNLEPEPVAVPKLRAPQRFRADSSFYIQGGAVPPDAGGVAWSKREAPEPLGLICSDDGEPLALDVNPAAFSSAHFATFPAKLVEPLVRAGTSQYGCCAACGAPWRRQVSKSGGTTGKGWTDHTADATAGMSKSIWANSVPGYKVETTGWAPGCAHDAAVVPCTILDPFGGAGTVGVVASRLQRDAVLIELSEPYTALADARIVDDAPLLAWGAMAEAAE